LLLAGLWTPVAGALQAIIEVWIFFSRGDGANWHLLLAALGVSLVMLGPGAWSVDAHLLDLSEKLAAEEKETIEAALRESPGRVFGLSGAATKLGIARSTLESKIRSLKISKNSFKEFAATIPCRSCLESVQ
jgi:transcriptional regulator with PAS, ATPase and Fis domain